MSKAQKNTKQLIPTEIIVNKIYMIRGMKVMLDRDLAAMYEVETKRFNEAVKRKIERFPEGFMFKLSKDEFQNLRSQFATSSWGGTRYLPLAFTEQGIAMLSSIINSTKAVAMNIAIMRAFVAIRKIALTNKMIAEKLSKMEEKLGVHDAQLNQIYEAIENLLDDKFENDSEPKTKRRIGFRPDE